MNREIAAHAAEPIDAAGCFALGMNYSAGAGVAVDLIEAHKWFNIAAMRGHAEASRLAAWVASSPAAISTRCSNCSRASTAPAPAWRQ